MIYTFLDSIDSEDLGSKQLKRILKKYIHNINERVPGTVNVMLKFIYERCKKDLLRLPINVVPESNKKRKVNLINTDGKVIGKCMGPIKQNRILYKI